MSDSTKQCGLSGTSRTDIFHDIAVDELTQMINMDSLSDKILQCRIFSSFFSYL